jgi:beta-glucosidase-like glycosyl hydrolase/CubicO group peptidase (beta-lactamase class C family)
MEEMSLDERIGQLFMIRAHSDLGADHIRQVKEQITKYHVGGLCFFQGTASKQVTLTNDYQSLTRRIPLMIAMDAEWGLGMRFSSGVISYPRQLMLGAIQDNTLIYEFGNELAEQFKQIGVHINFAPVVDINNNPNNPVINDRSFGEDKFNVATKGYMYMRGMQDGGIFACAKHFPGHGDTDMDSHFDLPLIPHDLSRLEDVELFPFQTLIKHDVKSLMVAHLSVPSLDNRKNYPSSLSNEIVTKLLINKMGYKGLIFTDGLEMQAVAAKFKNGEVEVKALEAGNDVLLLPNDLPLAFQTIKQHVLEGKISEQRINHSVRKILHAKYELGLTQYAPLPIHSIRSRLNHTKALSLKHKLIENAMTLVRNETNVVPLLANEPATMASLAIGTDKLSQFQLTLDEYHDIPRFLAKHQISSVAKEKLVQKLAKKDLIIISLHNMDKRARSNFGLDKSAIDLIHELNQKTKVLLLVFGSPYSLIHFDAIKDVMICYNDERLTQNLACQAVFGAIGLKGRLPVSASPISRFGMGVDTRSHFRIGFSVPERVGMQSDSLFELDRIMHEIIRKRAAPGGQLLVAKDGKIVYKKEYGWQTYDKKRPVQKDHVYDLASITKIAAATLSIMKLYDEGKIDLEAPVSQYLPELKNSNKANLRLKDIMAHRAQLIPWIPFYKETLTERGRRPSEKYYRKNKTAEFGVPISTNLFLRNDYPDTIWQQIVDSDLRIKKGYRYSDLGFYIVAKIVNKLSGESLDQYVNKHFYQPLGMNQTFFNPLNQLEKDDIVPSERDNYFRYDRLQGYVHDMGAGMLNGVSGHAGLFSNAGDLIKVFQMLLNHGYYGGRQYLKKETIQLFTKRHDGDTRRGIGFDMKELDENRPLNISPYASKNTYGHYGFTGTAVWVDPEYNLIYIFLSNRTYPSMRNNLLSREDYRAKLQSVIYKSFLPSAIEPQS